MVIAAEHEWCSEWVKDTEYEEDYTGFVKKS